MKSAGLNKDLNRDQKIIEGLLAILQGLLLIALSAITLFIVYLPLSLAMVIIFAVVGSICFYYGVESVLGHNKESKPSIL